MIKALVILLAFSILCGLPCGGVAAGRVAADDISITTAAVTNAAAATAAATTVATTAVTSAAAASAPVFADVPEGSWYRMDVNIAVRQGLILGKSATSFAPDDNLTQAEAVALASRCHQLLYSGEVTLAAGNPWYQPFFDFADANFLNGVGGWDLGAWDEATANKPITREYFVALFFLALQEGDYAPINSIADGSIPDVPMHDVLSGAIYAFYRAGILAGSDVERTFNPTTNITRAEVAAILTRITNDSPRMQFSLPHEQPDSAGAGASAGAAEETFTAYVALGDYEWTEYDLYGASAQFLVDDVLMLGWRDRELLIQYGFDPDGLENDYAIVNEDEGWAVFDPAPSAQFFVIYHPYEPYDGLAHSVDLIEFAGYLTDEPYRAEYGILAEVTISDGLIVSVTEIYTP
ncbi:MAG: S-layer homology domain-containing protein [Oscillospiraceae bacterium]|nr:S-layer homology domain-containing protein [Oscillospiraceae bacterium]